MRAGIGKPREITPKRGISSFLHRGQRVDTNTDGMGLSPTDLGGTLTFRLTVFSSARKRFLTAVQTVTGSVSTPAPMKEAQYESDDQWPSSGSDPRPA